MFVRLTQVSLVSGMGTEIEIAINVNHVVQVSKTENAGSAKIMFDFPHPDEIHGIIVKGTFDEVVAKLNDA